MKNKYYLTFLKIYEDNSQGIYYECIYENGISTKIVTIPFKEGIKIETKLN